MHTKLPTDELLSGEAPKTPTDDQINEFDLLFRDARTKGEIVREHERQLEAAKAEQREAIAKLQAFRANLFEGEQVAAA